MQITKARYMALVVIVVAAAAVLRFHQLGEKSLWFDECTSAQFSQRPIHVILRTVETPGGILPPFDFVLIHASARLGAGESWVRLPAAFMGIAAVYLSYLLGAALRGRAFGLWLAVLMALSPWHIAYSQEARPYSVYLTTALAASCFLLLAARRGGWKAWAGYAVCMSLCFYTHYHSVFVVVFHGVFLLLAVLMRPRRGDAEGPAVSWKTVGGWLCAVFAAFLLFSPWLPIMRMQYGGIHPRYKQPFSLGSFKSVEKVLKYYDAMLCGDVYPRMAFARASRVPAFLLLVLAAAVSLRKRRLATLFMLCGGVLPVAGIYLLSSLKPGIPFNARHVVPFLPYYLALCLSGLTDAAGSLRGVRARRAAFLYGIWVLLCIEGLGVRFYFEDYRKEDWRSIGGTLRAGALPGDAIAFYRGHLSGVIEYYYKGPQDTYMFDDEYTFLPGVLDDVRRHERVWLITGHIWNDGQWSGHREALGREMERGFRVLFRQNYGSDMEMTLYERKAKGRLPEVRGGWIPLHVPWLGRE